MTLPEGLDTEALLRRFLPGLRGFLRLRAGRLLLAKESCSDLAQSVCRDVLANVDKFELDGEEGFRRWLYTTAARKIADRYEYYLAARRNPNRELRQNEPDDEQLLQAYAGFYTPSQHAAAREELLRVEQAFASLGDDEQDLVVMAKMMGMSRAQIAAETGSSEVTVRKRLSRALARLTDLLAEPGQG